MGKYASREIDAATLGGHTVDYFAVAGAAVAKTVVTFAADSTPSLTNYQASYAATYGEHPNVQLVTIDGDGNYIARSEQPKFTMAAGLIDTISWDLPDAETGFIILRS